MPRYENVVVYVLPGFIGLVLSFEYVLWVEETSWQHFRGGRIFGTAIDVISKEILSYCMVVLY